MVSRAAGHPGDARGDRALVAVGPEANAVSLTWWPRALMDMPAAFPDLLAAAIAAKD